MRLGMTLGQVEAAWGRAYGRCRSCERPTLYFNLYALPARGSRRRAAPRPGRGGLHALGATGVAYAGRASGSATASPRVTATYGPMRRTSCRGYYAFTLDSRPGRDAVYVVGDEVWGFGLLVRGVPVCR